MSRSLTSLLLLACLLACGESADQVTRDPAVDQQEPLERAPDTPAARRALNPPASIEELGDTFPPPLTAKELQDEHTVQHALADIRIRHATLMELKRSYSTNKGKPQDPEGVFYGLNDRIERYAKRLTELEAALRKLRGIND